ncbi:adenylosuccinate synthetase [Stenotrophomonas phage BUCT555]|nr:adenylosuccinate synthetase [Stenotrophomonas phage BUCT555]
MSITAIVDLQFGSTGKGLIAGYLSEKNDYDMVISANMPNAGHTYVEADGTKRVHKVLPSGIYSKNLKYIAIGPGAVFDPSRLELELEGIRKAGIKAQVIIHPQAGVLRPEHKEAEQSNLSHISSTMQGSMAALVEKMGRARDGANIAKNLPADTVKWLNRLDCHIVSNMEWNGITWAMRNILMEGSQGYSLGLSAGFYPYCTSRDCTVWRLLADCGVQNFDGKLRVIGTARVHPIRVGNTADGNSGPCYSDQKELTWEDLGQTPETTTVTGRVRRVFTFSTQQIMDAMIANRVDEVFLNFCNYAPSEAIRIAGNIDTIGTELYKQRGYPAFVDKVNMVRYMGFGPAGRDILEVGHDPVW